MVTRTLCVNPLAGKNQSLTPAYMQNDNAICRTVQFNLRQTHLLLALCRERLNRTMTARNNPNRQRGDNYMSDHDLDNLAELWHQCVTLLEDSMPTDEELGVTLLPPRSTPGGHPQDE